MSVWYTSNDNVDIVRLDIYHVWNKKKNFFFEKKIKIDVYL